MAKAASLTCQALTPTRTTSTRPIFADRRWHVQADKRSLFGVHAQSMFADRLQVRAARNKNDLFSGLSEARAKIASCPAGPEHGYPHRWLIARAMSFKMSLATGAQVDEHTVIVRRCWPSILESLGTHHRIPYKQRASPQHTVVNIAWLEGARVLDVVRKAYFTEQRRIAGSIRRARRSRTQTRRLADAAAHVPRLGRTRRVSREFAFLAVVAQRMPRATW